MRLAETVNPPARTVSAYATATGVDDQLTGIENAIGTRFADTLDGFSQDNVANLLIGGAGADTLMGRGGADVLVGGAGDDDMTGDDDTYFVPPGSPVQATQYIDHFVFEDGFGNDTIHNFSLRGVTDRIDFYGMNITYADLVFNGSVITITGHPGESITLDSVNAASLGASAFSFHAEAYNPGPLFG